MKQRLLLLSLLTVFCVKGMSQGSENIPVEGNKFYMEKGIPSSSQAVTRGDNSETWTFKSVVENCFDETKKDRYSEDGLFSKRVAYSSDDSILDDLRHPQRPSLPHQH